MNSETVNGQSIACYDNEGRTFDRYAVAFLNTQHNGYFVLPIMTMSKRPNDANGVCQYGQGVLGPHLGKEIAFDSLPEECRKVVLYHLQVEASR